MLYRSVYGTYFTSINEQILSNKSSKLNKKWLIYGSLMVWVGETQFDCTTLLHIPFSFFLSLRVLGKWEGSL